jgi:K+-transporting ATPase ATPase C chain
MPLSQVMGLVSDNTEGRFIGLFGEPGVNVVKLNLAIEEEARS